MNDLQLLRISSLLGIGQPTRSPEQVGGGLLHKVWHIITGQKEFAIKELNMHIMTQPGMVQAYRDAENVADRAVAQGIPGVTAYRFKGEAILDVEGGLFLVFDWIKGNILPLEQIKPTHATLMGEIINRIHRLNMPKTLVEEKPTRLFSNEYWNQLIDKFHHLPLLTLYSTELGSDLKQFLPQLHMLNMLAHDAQPKLRQNTVVSHGDLDPKNVMWRDNQSPVLIDWESAQRLNPTLEVIACALDWAGISSGNIDFKRYFSLIEGYTRHGDRLSAIDFPYAFYGVAGNWLAWLEYNIRRASGEISVHEEEQILGARMIAETLLILKCLIKNMESLINNTPSNAQ